MSADNQESSDHLEIDLEAIEEAEGLTVNLKDAYNGWWGVPYLINPRAVACTGQVPEKQAEEREAEIEAQRSEEQAPEHKEVRLDRVGKVLSALRMSPFHR